MDEDLLDQVQLLQDRLVLVTDLQEQDWMLELPLELEWLLQVLVRELQLQGQKVDIIEDHVQLLMQLFEDHKEVLLTQVDLVLHKVEATCLRVVVTELRKVEVVIALILGHRSLQ